LADLLALADISKTSDWFERERENGIPAGGCRGWLPSDQRPSDKQLARRKNGIRSNSGGFLAKIEEKCSFDPGFDSPFGAASLAVLGR
jgi:hypothetical protein